MTEQEKREKAIEDMVVNGERCFCFDPNIGWFNCRICKYRPCYAFDYCGNLYDAGYRKADEATKANYNPTAKEFVKLEIEELRGRREKLSNFLYGERRSQLTGSEILLLTEQLSIMDKYIEVLDARLYIWRELPEVDKCRKK